MNSFIKFMDDLPKLAKAIIAIIPFVQILWSVYRIIKSVKKDNLLGIILAVLLILPGCTFMWVVDFICILVMGKIWWID